MTDKRIVSHARQADILDPALAADTHITILGMGTVGSNVAVELARLGIGSLHLIDFDKVEPHNLPSQRFNLSDLDRNKAEAAADQVKAVSHCDVTFSTDKLLGGEFLPDGPVLMAMDSNEARMAMVQQSLKFRPNHPIVFDFGMGANHMQIFTMDPSNTTQIKTWETFMDPSMAAEPLPCGGRTVSYVGAGIGCFGANHIRKFLNKEKLPFLTQVNLDALTITTN